MKIVGKLKSQLEDVFRQQNVQTVPKLKLKRKVVNHKTKKHESSS